MNPINEETDVVVNTSGLTYLSLAQYVLKSSHNFLCLLLDRRVAGFEREKASKRKRAAGNDIAVTNGRLIDLIFYDAEIW